MPITSKVLELDTKVTDIREAMEEVQRVRADGPEL